MRGFPSEYVDLIYADPPFNTKRRDNIVDYEDSWASSDSYLAFIVERLQECKRLLRDTGSLYLHCDTNYSHYLKVELDKIFGRKNYRNDITWKRHFTPNRSDKRSQKFRNSKDTILFYAKQAKSNTFNRQYISLPEFKSKRTINGRQYNAASACGSKQRHFNNHYEYKGYIPDYGWCITKDKLVEYDKAGRLIWSKNGLPNIVYFLDESKGYPVTDLWIDFSALSGNSTERVNYSTQKPLQLLERIILASSEEDDLILDPFCGSGTSLVAAKSLGRMYIGIDSNPRAIEISRKRLSD